MGDFLRDPLVHVVRQIEPVVQHIHVAEQQQHLSGQFARIVELPPDHSRPNLLPVAAAEKAQDVQDRIADLFAVVEPKWPLGRHVQKIGSDLRDFGGLARVVVPAVEGESQLSLPTQSLRAGGRQAREFVEQGPHIVARDRLAGNADDQELVLGR
ncbi:MAG: hypothetical protein MUC88_29755 [Planctomycetes bacterium]|nr:hypothetical protein [Planctomycetota bacterium]